MKVQYLTQNIILYAYIIKDYNMCTLNKTTILHCTNFSFFISQLYII